MSFGPEEREAVNRVMDSGNLSGFLAGELEGGPEVQALEKEWAKYFKVNYAVSMNSATSCLLAALMAERIGPGDEVIVSPWSMSATVAVVVMVGATPVFADIEKEYFCLDPIEVEKKITEKTRAVIATDLFGQPCDIDRIRNVTSRDRISVIEDASQAPGATYNSSYAGTSANYGIFSLNYHKHIHCGEGGIIVTPYNYNEYRLQLIRNHAECDKTDGYVGVGLNLRLTEIQAAITREQLKKLKDIVSRRQAGITDFSRWLTPTRDNATHAYYLYPINNTDNIFAKRYVKPLYRLPAFQKYAPKEPLPNVEWAYENVRVLTP